MPARQVIQEAQATKRLLDRIRSSASPIAQSDPECRDLLQQLLLLFNDLASALHEYPNQRTLRPMLLGDIRYYVARARSLLLDYLQKCCDYDENVRLSPLCRAIADFLDVPI